MATEQVLHMNGGVGETSYANNSFFQRNVILNTKNILEDSIMRLYCTTLPNCLKVADLGCSSGPNALMVASTIIKVVDATIQTLNRGPPMFQFFLNDLYGNDFNTIFKSLPEFYKSLEEEMGHKFGQCFISGMPGTFYGRLFPNDSIHFFHSSYSLHWLSQAPKELTNEAEPINKGAIFLSSTSPPSVHKAYFEQFRQDFKLFLRLRSKELVPGGGMFLTFAGSDENHELINAWVIVDMALDDMNSENLIEKKKLDSFNVPTYCPTAEEVKQGIQEEGSFNLQRLETVRMNWIENVTNDDSFLDDDMKAEMLARNVRAITEPILKEEFGEGIMDELFRRCKNKVVQLMRVDINLLEHASQVMYMTKKN